MTVEELQREGFTYVTENGEPRCIGKGSFGKALLVKDVHGQVFVAKEMDLNGMGKKDRLSAENEVKLLQQLDHPFVIKFVHSFVSTKNIMYIIMEYADGGDLSIKLKNCKKNRQVLSEEQIMLWFAQLCLALDHLHEKRILHRDLKSMNVFLTSTNIVKLGDFGFSKKLATQQAFARTVCGTPYYFSPELCNGYPYSNKSDVWSLGVILYEMGNMQRPYEATNLQELMKKILYGDFSPCVSTCPPHVRDLINSVLTKKDSLRPAVAKILKDAYVREYVDRLPKLMTVQPSENRYPKASALTPSPPPPTTSADERQQNIRQKMMEERKKREMMKSHRADETVVSPTHAPVEAVVTSAPAVTEKEMNVLAKQIEVPTLEEEYSLVFEEYESDFEEDDEAEQTPEEKKDKLNMKEKIEKGIKEKHDALVTLIGEDKLQKAIELISETAFEDVIEDTEFFEEADALLTAALKSICTEPSDEAAISLIIEYVAELRKVAKHE